MFAGWSAKETRGSPRNSSNIRHASDIDTASAPNALGFVASRRKPLLRQAAERATVVRQTLKPILAALVMDMRSEGQGQPQVDVSQKHPRLPEAPRRARRLVDDSPVDRTARAAIGLDVENWADPLLTAPCRRPSPPHPPAAGVRPPEPRRRYGRDQEFPYLHSQSQCNENQVHPSVRSGQSMIRTNPANDWPRIHADQPGSFTTLP